LQVVPSAIAFKALDDGYSWNFRKNGLVAVTDEIDAFGNVAACAAIVDIGLVEIFEIESVAGPFLALC
jgi:hypothetical protein